MEDIRRKMTNESPGVYFSPDGNLTLLGRMIIKDAPQFFQEPITFCKRLRAKQVNFMVRIEYMNTASTKSMFRLFNALKENTAIENIVIQWFYDEADFQMLEMGHDFEDIFTDLIFDFIPCDESIPAEV